MPQSLDASKYIHFPSLQFSLDAAKMLEMIRWRTWWTDTQRLEVFLRFDCQCVYCDKELEFSDFEIDHFIPWNITQDDSAFNLVLCCHACNRLKASKVFNDYEDVRKFIREQNPFSAFGEGGMPEVREGVYSLKKVAKMVQLKVQGKYVDEETKRQKEARDILDSVFGVERSSEEANA